MGKDKKKDVRNKKAVSWYVSMESGGETCNGEDKEFLMRSGDHQSKAKSVDVSSEMRKRTISFSKFCGSDKIPRADTGFKNSMEWLEVTLSRRRSETRVYKHNTQLIESIADGDTAYMSRMLAMGASPNATCRLNHVSACHIAAMYNHDALALLVHEGAERMRADKLGRTPLHLAAWAGNAKQIAILLNFPEALRNSVLHKMSPETIAEVKAYSSDVYALVNTSCELNVPPTLPESWSDGIDHNCRLIKDTLPVFQSGWTALHAASARAQHHCVELLLAAGADVCAQDLLCRTPLDVAGCAHYMGHKIEVSDFRETIRILLKAGGKFQGNTASNVNTPLHTAVELKSEEAVEDLLKGGASATCLNVQGLTAMHVCVQKRFKEALQLLANYEYSNEDPHVAIVDTKDRWGFTVLRAAIKVVWVQGVCIALGAGASVTMKANDGETSIHSAVALGNIDILQEVLTVAKFNSAIDYRNEKGETALFIAISNNHTDVVKLLLKGGANIIEVSSNKVNVFHVAAQHGSKDVLEHLLEYDSHITAKMINKPDSKYFTPLVYAVTNNHPECVELLISKGAVVDIEVPYDDGISNVKIQTTLLHIAASKNHFKIARIIVDHDIKTIHKINDANRLPLHEACCHGNRDIIELLLHKGANLSGQNERCKTQLPIDMLMHNLSKPTEFMEEIFDSYISSKGVNLQESDCKVTVNYKILVPNEADKKQMSVIKALINTGNRYDQNRLLLHPLVQSFLYLKWQALLPFFYTILAFHGCFVLALNVYVVSVFYYNDKDEEVPCYLHSDAWKHIMYVTVFLIAVQEIIFIKIKNKRYFLRLETWLKLWAVVLAVFLPHVVSWDTKLSPEWARLMATFALLFSWFEMMFLLSRFPDWGFYILMFGKVANKVLKILLSFGFLILGFSICFMIQFCAQPPFDEPWAAFVKTMVMMTSEYDYQSTIKNENANNTSITILRLIFMIFLILVSIVLMNLIVGVAVNNVNHLEMIGNRKRLEKQVEFITSLEDIVCHKVIRKILPNVLYKKWLTNQKLKNVIVLTTRESTCNYYKRLPARIREAIFEKAQFRKKLMDRELDSMVSKMKLDEIHNAIVGKDNIEAEKSDNTDNVMNKLLEKIDKIHADIEFIKLNLAANRRRTISSNNSSFL